MPFATETETGTNRGLSAFASWQSSNWCNHFCGPLLCQRSDAFEYEPLEVPGCHVRFERRLVPILFPQDEHVRILLPSGDVESDHAFLPA